MYINITLFFFFDTTDVQNGRCECGNVGRTIQQRDQTGGLHSQPQVLSVWLHRESLDGALPVAETDDLFVG